MGKPQRAAPAKRAPSNPYRNRLIGKAKLACKQLGIEDDDYRAMLMEETGKDSLTKCTDAQIVNVIELLKRKGFRAAPAKGNRGEAGHPVARKARVMWHSLHLLGEIRNPSEKALEAFACKQLKCAKFAWANQSQGGKVIEALKDMAVRNGWVQVGHDNKPLDARGLTASLCRAIIQKLQDMDEVPAGMTFALIARHIFGIQRDPNTEWSIDEYQQLAKAAGKKLREATGDAS